MSEEDDFLRETRMARLLAQTENADEAENSLEDLRVARRLASLRDDSEEASPAQDDALMSEGAKNALKKAGALAALAGRWGASKAKVAADAAREKAVAAKAAIDTKRVADAERKRVDAESLADTKRKEARTQQEQESIHAECDLAPTALVDRQAAARSRCAIQGTVIGEVATARSHKKLALSVGAVALLMAAAGGAYWWSQQTKSVVARLAIEPTRPAVPIASPMPAAVVEPVPVEMAAPLDVVAPVPVPVDPKPVVVAVPVPVAPPVSAPTSIAAPKPATKRVANVVAPKDASVAKPNSMERKEDWQDKAQDDMAQFEKQMGIK